LAVVAALGRQVLPMLLLTGRRFDSNIDSTLMSLGTCKRCGKAFGIWTGNLSLRLCNKCSEPTTGSSVTGAPPVSASSEQKKRNIGIMLVVVGIIVTTYFTAIYDTSVTTKGEFISGVGYIGGDSVVNLEKQQNRLIGVIIGIALAGVGVAILYLPGRRDQT
jgi:hypothetical protein